MKKNTPLKILVVSLVAVVVAIVGLIAIGDSSPVAIKDRSVSLYTPREELTEDQIIEKVKQQPDVKEWLKDFPDGVGKSTGGKPSFRFIDSYRPRVLRVVVEEDMPDHVSFFASYDVNTISGEVTPVPVGE